MCPAAQLIVREWHVSLAGKRFPGPLASGQLLDDADPVGGTVQGCVVEGHECTVGGRVHVRLQVGVAEVDGVLEGDCCVFQFGAAHALIVDEPAAPVSQCHGAGGGKVDVSHSMQYAVFCVSEGSTSACSNGAAPKKNLVFQVARRGVGVSQDR